MGLSLTNLDTRLQALVGDTVTGNQTDRYNALADADVELSSIRGYWRVRSHAYTTSSSPAMTANLNTLSVPSDFEAPNRLYYRESGLVKDVEFKSRSEWLQLSDTSQADYPRWARLTQSGSTLTIELDRLLSSAFTSTIGTLTLEYWIAITRLASGSDQSILPDTLRHYIVPVAGMIYALGQSDFALVDRLKPEAERAREAVLRFDIEHISRPRQIRPSMAYMPSDGGALSADYSE